MRQNAATALLLVIVAALGIAAPSLALGGPDVTVVNPPSQPVPVSGSINVIGTPSVTIGNASTTPVPIRDVDNPARRAFQRQVSFQFAAGADTGSVSFSVPNGKRLVIEYVSARASLPAGQRMVINIRTTLDLNDAFHVLRNGLTETTGVLDVLEAGESVRIYADPSKPVEITAARNSFAGTADFFATVSGYLVDVP